MPASNYADDIDNEHPKNYAYNSIGQLASDTAGGIDTITWTIYGKVKKIIKKTTDSIVFEYDPLGNRIEKRVYPKASHADTTLYSRDAQGNILAIYDRKYITVRLSEWDIYGSKRIGVVDTSLLLYSPPAMIIALFHPNPFDSSTIGYNEGQKQYELTNHLGNVLVTLTVNIC